MESLIPLVLVFLFMWFLLIRPQQRRVRAQRSMLDALSVGDEVITVGGMCGRIIAMDDELITLEVANDVEIRFVRAAVRQRVEPESPMEDDALGEGEA